MFRIVGIEDHVVHTASGYRDFMKWVQDKDVIEKYANAHLRFQREYKGQWTTVMAFTIPEPVAK